MKQRIAVVAVSALTAGVLSVASAPVANAGALDMTAAVNGTAVDSTQGVITATPALGAAITTTTATGKMFVTGQVSMTFTAGALTSSLIVTGGTITSCTQGGGTGVLSVDKSTCAIASANTLTIVAKPSAVGTNLVIKGMTTDGVIAGTVGRQITISVVASTTANAFSAADSFLSTENTGIVATDNIDATRNSASGVTLIPVTTVVNGGSGFFGYDVLDSNSQRLVGATIVGTTTGNCTVGAGAAGTYNSAVSSTANSYFRLDQVTANAPTVCVLTVAVNGATVATRTYTMLGELTSIGAPTSQKIVPATGVSVATMFKMSALDSAGNLLDNVVMAPVSAYYNAALTTVSNVTTKPGGSASADNGADVTCSTAGTYKMQMAAVNASVKTILSPVFDITCGGAVVNYTAGLDKASYVPGDIAVLTIKATDKSKLTAHDANYLGGATADGSTTANPPAISGSNLTAVTAPASTDLFVSGVKTYKFVVGSTEGAYNMVVDLPKFNSTTYSQTALTVAYKIAGSTATVSNADVLKSIVALIASINKQIQALQALILKKK